MNMLYEAFFNYRKYPVQTGGVSFKINLKNRDFIDIDFSLFEINKDVEEIKNIINDYAAADTVDIDIDEDGHFKRDSFLHIIVNEIYHKLKDNYADSFNLARDIEKDNDPDIKLIVLPDDKQYHDKIRGLTYNMKFVFSEYIRVIG